MDTLLSSLAFAAFLIAQVTAVIALHAELPARPPGAFGARFDHLAGGIRNSAD